MHRHLVRLLPLCFLVSACGTSSRHQALLERREAIRASNAAHEAEFIASFRSADGFQDTRWGMSPDEVKPLYPGAWMTRAQGDLRATTQVADRRATVDFLFTQDKLAAIRVTFESADPLREEFGSLSELLELKYGRPVSRVDTAEDAEKRLWTIESDNDRTENVAQLRELGSKRRSTRDPVDAEDRQWEEEARLEALAARNDYALQAEWKDSETELVLFGRQTPARSSLTLDYESRHLKPYLARERADSGARRKRELAGEL